MRSIIFEWFLYLSTAGFWTVVGMAIYRVRRASKGIHDKMRTKEKVVAVLTTNNKKKTIG